MAPIKPGLDAILRRIQALDTPLSEPHLAKLKLRLPKERQEVDWALALTIAGIMIATFKLKHFRRLANRIKFATLLVDVGLLMYWFLMD